VKGANFLAINTNNAGEFVLFEHRDEEKGAPACYISQGDYRRIVFNVGFFRPDVRNVLQLLRCSHTAKRVVLPTGLHNRFTPPERRPRTWRTV
jgi:hypothetical protein